MDTAQNEKYSISAHFLGPVYSLDGQLSKNAQNLIFAKNGTGKSFLSRAFRYLDLICQDKNITDAAHNLVSDESHDERGEFSFSRGESVLGKLSLKKTENTIGTTESDTIFHVFNDDFIQEELRDRKYEINGAIENKISVDSINIALQDAKKAWVEAKEKRQISVENFREKFNVEKSTELHKKAAINTRLKEYKDLNFESMLNNYIDLPDPFTRSLGDVIKDLHNVKTMPQEPTYPGRVPDVKGDDLSLEPLEKALQKVTSPSSVFDEIKNKIDAHQDFFKMGIDMVNQNDLDNCPFCEQGITSPDPKTIIKAYTDYFADKEQRHKSELRDLVHKLEVMSTALITTKSDIGGQQELYNKLKFYVPSRRETAINDGLSQLADINTAITNLTKALKTKIKMLSSPRELPENDLNTDIENINKIISANNNKSMKLFDAATRIDEERRKLQRKACGVFEREFVIGNWAEFEILKDQDVEITKLENQLTAIENASPSEDARARVSKTFALLLKYFFDTKYTFEQDTFEIKREQHKMKRGSQRTLSDGEKTVIAFCYFVACVHRKVKSNSDYGKVFLVFDDPVTSMSYDFIYSVAQTLKNLRVSDAGVISSNPTQIDRNECKRPQLLILTHSTYFLNICSTNSIVKEGATFCLEGKESNHKLVKQKKFYMAPFEHQLKDIYDVATEKEESNHTTGNSIRSVLEAVGRFCRPDKAKLTDFINFLATDLKIEIKSTLINSLSHGTYDNQHSSHDDIKAACEEVVKVVEHFAIGQVKVIEKENSALSNSDPQ